MGCTLYELSQVTEVIHANTKKLSMSWSSDSTKEFRVQAALALPEGGLSWTLDTLVVGNTFLLTLPKSRGLIKAQVSRGCESLTLNELLSTQPIAYFNPLSSCFLSNEDLKYEKSMLQILPQNGVESYSLSQFSISEDTFSKNLSTKLIKKVEIIPPFRLTNTGFIQLDLEKLLSPLKVEMGVRQIVSILPKCGLLTGPPIAIAIN